MAIKLPDKRIVTRQPNGVFDVDRSSQLLGNKTYIITGSNSAIDVGSRKPFSTRNVDRVTGPYGLEYYGTAGQSIVTPSVSDGTLPITMAAIFNGYVSSSAGPVYYFGQRWSGGHYAFLDCWDSTIGNFRSFSTPVTDGVYNFLVATIDESRLISFYVNGILIGSVTAGNTESYSAPEYGIVFDTATVYGRSPLLIKTNKAWKAEQVKAWQANPWQVFSKPSPIVYGFISSSSVTHDTSGALTGQGSTIAGTANHSALHATSGALTGQGATVAGSATRFHAFATTGALIGQGSTLSGSAAHNATHSTSGALTGLGSSIVGSADRQPPGSVTHSTSGTLTGQGAILSGTAARLREFSSSGALVGQGSVISGTAVHNIPHSATGALIGDIGSIVGTAARIGAPVSHATSGDLVGSGATLSGSASRSGASVLTPEDLTNIANAVWAHTSAVHCQLLLIEVWGRLGLDPSAPLISGQTEISFGSIVMALTEASGTVTATRQ